MVNQMKERSWFDRYPKTTAFFLGILILFGMEVIGQLAFYFANGHTFLFQLKKGVDTVFTPYGLFEYKPKIAITMAFKYPAELRVDRYGFIHNGNDQEIIDTDFQIFLLGGSTVEGRGASSNAATIAANLERILNEKSGRHVRVINAAILGYMSYQEIARIDGKILRSFKPDMIIALDGRNDAYYMASYVEWEPYWQPYYDRLESDVNKCDQPSVIRSVAYCLSNNSAVARLIRRMYIWIGRKEKKIIHTRASTVPDEVVEQAAAAYLSSHVSAQAKCRFLNIPYLVFLQPVLTKSLKHTLLPEETHFIEEWKTEYLRPDIYYPGIEHFYQKAAEKSAVFRLDWFYDISRIFEGSKERVYFDSCHYTDRGNVLIAQKIYEVIAPLVGNSPSALSRQGKALETTQEKNRNN